MDLNNPAINELTKERKDEMFYLIARFAMQMCKRAANAQEETIHGLKVLVGKRSRLFGLDEEV